MKRLFIMAFFALALFPFGKSRAEMDIAVHGGVGRGVRMDMLVSGDRYYFWGGMATIKKYLEVQFFYLTDDYGSGLSANGHYFFNIAKMIGPFGTVGLGTKLSGTKGFFTNLDAGVQLVFSKIHLRIFHKSMHRITGKPNWGHSGYFATIGFGI